MRKIIYYGISSDAPSLPSPFLPKFLELLDDDVDTLAAHGAFSNTRNVVITVFGCSRRSYASWGLEIHATLKFLRTCLAASQVSRFPVDKRHVSSGIHANHTTGHALLPLEFLEFKKGAPEFNLFSTRN